MEGAKNEVKEGAQEESMGMAELLGPEKTIETGKVSLVRVVAKNSDGLVVDLGLKAEGFVDKNEFQSQEQFERIQAGDDVPVYIISLQSKEGAPVVSYKKAREMAGWERVNAAFKSGEPVEGVIAREIKGGFIVDIGVDAFLPGSQLDVYRVKDPKKYLGIRMKFMITEIKREKNSIVVSRRKLIDFEQKEARKKVLSTLAEGQIVDGIVSRIADFGAFVDIDGMDGLLHVGDIAWHRIDKIEDFISVRQSVKVKILKIDNEKEQVQLGMKQLYPRPWESAPSKYPKGSTVKCKVTSITDFGVFAELEPGFEGLLHVSEISWADQSKGALKNFKKGQEIELKVIAIDPKEEKLSLSLKRLKNNPWEEAKKTYAPMTKLKGTVTNVVPFGAFVKLPNGLEGLVHVGDISWTKKVNHPQEHFKKGQEIEVVVLNVDADNEKISLSFKHLSENPLSKYEAGKIVSGKVKTLADFGAFVELEPGLDALVRISEISRVKIGHPSEVLKVGQEVEARVLKCDLRDRKIDISIKKLDAEREKELIKKYVNQNDRPTLGDLLSSSDDQE